MEKLTGLELEEKRKAKKGARSPFPKDGGKIKINKDLVNPEDVEAGVWHKKKDRSFRKPEDIIDPDSENLEDKILDRIEGDEDEAGEVVDEFSDENDGEGRADYEIVADRSEYKRRKRKGEGVMLKGMRGKNDPLFTRAWHQEEAKAATVDKEIAENGVESKDKKLSFSEQFRAELQGTAEDIVRDLKIYLETQKFTEQAFQDMVKAKGSQEYDSLKQKWQDLKQELVPYQPTGELLEKAPDEIDDKTPGNKTVKIIRKFNLGKLNKKQRQELLGIIDELIGGGKREVKEAA